MTLSFPRRSEINVKSLEKFVEAIQEGGGTYVNAHPYLVRSAWHGRMYSNDYMPVAVFHSRTRDGRPIIFKETYPARTKTSYGRMTYFLALRIMLTVDDRLQTIRRYLPADDLYMAVMGRREPLDDEKFQSMLNRARNYKLAPF